MEAGWEKSVKKHIFVLSSAGKPIFSRYGDEQDIVTTFGLIQAVISIVQDAGDQLQCIQSGSRKIVYFSKSSLYFVAVSSTGEPEAVLRQQLEFIYYQIIFVLTAKVHDILKSNPSKDLRELLGSDTKRLMHAVCECDITPPAVVFNSVKGFALDSAARARLLTLLTQCLAQSNAALGCIICEESLLVYSVNEEMQVTVDVKDMLLLTHFVHNSPSLRCHDQNNWVPLCLPSLNAAGYVQAYISPLQLSCGVSSSSGDKLYSGGGPSSLSLVLISASNGSGDDVKRLHDARIHLQSEICDGKMSSRLTAALSNRDSICQNLLATVNGLHFFYKHKLTAVENCPAQCIWSKLDLNPEVSYPPGFEGRIWIHCYRLALCLREGSSSRECTLLSPAELKPKSFGRASVSGDSFGTKGGDEVRRRMQGNSFASPPAADHALAYTILDSGEVCVGLATSYSELFVTFPNTVDALEACSLANILTRYIKKDTESLFFSG